MPRPSTSSPVTKTSDVPEQPVRAQGLSRERHSGLAVAGTVALVMALAGVVSIGQEFGAAKSQRVWVASGQYLDAIDGESGRIATRIDGQGAVRSFALDPVGQRAWVLVGREVRAYSVTGALVRSFAVDVPEAGNASLILGNGRIWLAFDAGVLLLDERGATLSNRPLRGPLVGVSANARMGWLWLATVEEMMLLDEQGRILQQLSMQSAGELRAIDYDPYHEQVWVLTDAMIQRYTWEGERTFMKPDSALAGMTRIAADRSGGLWLASSRALAHLDGNGMLRFRSKGFGAEGHPVSMAVDRGVWLVSLGLLHHFGPDGTLFNKLRVPHQATIEPALLALQANPSRPQ